MIKFVDKLDKIKDSNLFLIIEKKEDLEKLSFLKLEKNITLNLLSVLKKRENVFKEYFLWRKDFSRIFIVFYLDKEKRNIYEILWENIIKLPDNFTIISNSKENNYKFLESSLLTRYKFQYYKSEKKEDKIYFLCDKKEQKLLEERKKVIDIIIDARDMWETPTHDLHPEIFANKIKKYKWKNTKVKIFDPKKIQKEWLWLIWAVWKWSKNKPYMVVLERIVDKKLPTIWLVWKWVVFDSGWINLKPEKWLPMMKDDMCAAANVFWIMKNLDEKKLNINIVCAIPLVENAIWWDAYRPSDIIKSYSWKTVHIVNTDAEWRLILADAISYISKNYKLERIISLATLTWLALFALWFRYAWIMWDDRKLINELLKNSETDFEKYIELPFDNYFVEKTKSNIADLDNLTDSVLAWSSMWAAFLYNFLENKEKFTHIDIAWIANNTFEVYGLYAKATTWFWIDSLSKIILNYKK